MYGLTNYRKGDFDIFDPFKGFFDNMSADPSARTSGTRETAS